NDVRGADPRVRPYVPAQIHALARARDPGDERVRELLRRADQRVDGPVVVAVRVDVEQPRRPAERRADRVDDGPVAPLGEVRHGLEREHLTTLGRWTHTSSTCEAASTTRPVARTRRSRSTSRRSP